MIGWYLLVYLSMYNPTTIANYFIKKSFDTGIGVSPMKLIKLIYLAHGWNLAIQNEPLINEAIQAWKYGPVISSVYQNVKFYKNSYIPSTIFTLQKEPIDDRTNQLLDKVWDVYQAQDGLQLSTITHQENSPWDIVWNQKGGKDKDYSIIPNDIIKDYYLNLIESNKRNAAQNG